MVKDMIKIKDRIRDFVDTQFGGFDEFKNDENLVNSEKMTGDFVLRLIHFLEKEFDVKCCLTIDSIGDFVMSRPKALVIEEEGAAIEMSDLIKIFDN